MVREVAVTGAGGFVGRALCARLNAAGYAVTALGREPERMRLPAGVARRRFDPNESAPNPAAFEDVDAVVHLAGESVAGRWTARKKRAIAASRIAGTRAVVAALALAERRPRVLVCASATGYYGARGDEALDEGSAPGADFLANVCVEWEREAARAAELGIRVVRMRTGIVLGDGGALRAMTPPFRFGAGGPFGRGRQFVPWIALEDLVEMFLFALERDDVAGPMNAVTPDYATSARFAQALGAALHRPALLPAPAFALRLVLGEFASTLLGSQLVIPAVAQDAGFVWRRPYLEDALAALFPQKRAWPVVREFRAEQFVPLPPAQVFASFADARNLETITPPSLRFAIRRHAPALRRGAQIDYALRLHGIPLRWRTMIARWDPPHGFDDVQLHGPYALWHHEHRFVPEGDGVRITDRVRYALPFFPFGALASRFVAADVRRIFEYRRAAIPRLVRDASADPVHAAP